MSTVEVKLNFRSHLCTNHTLDDFTVDLCDDCTRCRCEDDGYCCGEDRSSAYCPDCGCEIDRPICYACDGENCGCGTTIDAGEDVTYTGVVWAKWVNGTLTHYRGDGHPHLNGSYCLGSAAPLFENVVTKEQAVEAIVTHISNVDFNDGLGGPYHAIEAA